MDSDNVEILFSYLTEDENNYPTQHHEKGSDKNSYLLSMWAKNHVKLWFRAKKTSKKKVGHSQGICYHAKAQKVHVKEQMEFISNSTTVLPYGTMEAARLWMK